MWRSLLICCVFWWFRKLLRCLWRQWTLWRHDMVQRIISLWAHRKLCAQELTLLLRLITSTAAVTLDFRVQPNLRNWQSMAPMDLSIEFWGLPRCTSLNMILNWEKVAIVFFFHAIEEDHVRSCCHDGWAWWWCPSTHAYPCSMSYQKRWKECRFISNLSLQEVGYNHSFVER